MTSCCRFFFMSVPISVICWHRITHHVARSTLIILVANNVYNSDGLLKVWI